MTKTRSTKSALISSVIALLLCFTMLLGTTFAWFTDSVTSANNIIKSGNLDIALDYWDGDSWETVQGTNSLFTNNLWEPGHTEVVYLKLSNLGSLALKYQLAINVLSETEGTNMAGDPFKLSDYIKMGVVEGVNGETNAYADRATAVEAVKDASGIIGDGYAKQGNMLKDDPELYMAVVVYMPENVSNEANAMTGTDAPIINLGVQVLATQYTAEGDSFNDQYDKDAWMDGMQVYTASDLQAAINAGENDIKLMDDITLDAPIVIPAAATTFSLRAAAPATVIDLNGKTITGSMHKNDGAVIKNEGNLILKNGTVSSTGNNGGSALVNNGTAVLENVTLNGAPNADGSWPSYTVNNTGVLEATNVKFTSYHGSVASYGDGAIVTLNNCEIDMAGIPGFTSHGIYTYNNGAVVVNGGTYANKATDQAASGASVINGAVTVNAGTFNGRIENYYGTPVINGGTFDAAPSAYVADGYHTLSTDGKYYVVPEKIDAVVSNTAELQAAINAGDDEIILTEGNFTAELYANNANRNLTLIGQGAGTKLSFSNQQVNLALFDSLTIKNCTIEKMATKSWGHLVFGSSKNAGGVYTISECIFNGVGTQGIYINQVADATFKVEKCTFNGDFGDEGAITIQDNPFKFTVNVTDCEFNNIPETSHGIYTARNNTTGDGEWALIVDGKRTAVHSGSLKNAAADGVEVVYFMDGEYGVIDVRVGSTLTIMPHDGATVKFAGINGQSNNNASDITIKGITIDNSLATAGWYTGTSQNMKPCVGVWGGNYTFEDCKFFVTGESKAETGVMSWWTTNHGTMTFNGCTFNGGNGSARGMQIYGDYDLNVEDCTFTTAKDYAIKFVGDEGCKATLTGNKVYNTVNFVQAGSAPYAGTNYTIEFKNNILANGINSIYVDNDENQTIIIDGKKYVYNDASLVKAVAAGETEINLLAGNYTMPQDSVFQGKTLTISGTKDAVIDISAIPTNGSQAFTGTTLVFDGVTLNCATTNYKGFTHGASLTYKNCQINGLQFLFAENVTFDNCDLNSNGAEHCVWTWSGNRNVRFTECDFTYGDRAVNCYGENGTTNISFTKCTFTKVAGKETTGAIETNSASLTALNLTINDCTVNEGNLWFVANPWDSLKGANTFVTVDGKVTVATAEQLRALAATATGDVEVVLSSDITLGNDTDVCEAVNFANATSVTIDGNGNSIIFKGKAANKSDTSLDSVSGILSAGEITVKNVTLVNNKLSYFGTELSGDRIQVYTVVRGTSVSYENVTFEGGVQVKNNTKFLNCTFNEDCLDANGDGYATNGKFCVFVDFEWSTDAVCTVEFEGCTFNASGYGCVKLAGDAGAELTAKVKDCTFNNTCPSNSWSTTTPKYDVKCTGDKTSAEDLGGNTWAKGLANT